MKLSDGVADATAAVTAGIAVAPFVVVVDKAIAESASGKRGLWSSFGASVREFVFHPIKYLRQPGFHYLACLYGGTYMAANLFSTYEEYRQEEAPYAKAGSIFAVNASLSLWKDSAFAKLYGNKAPARVPAGSLAMWYSRDLIGMSTIFVAPPIVAKYLHEKQDMDRQRAELLTQISLPLAIQVVVAPFHLMGYIIYNQPTATLAVQMKALRDGVWGTLVMRWIRVFPPFSIGTVLNKTVRKQVRDIHIQARQSALSL